jgi:hypothetical protein
MSTLPLELINLIMSYMSSPTSKIIKNAFQEINDEMNEIFPGDYEYGGSDYTIADDTSFARYYFIKQYEKKNMCEVIYSCYYATEEDLLTSHIYNRHNIYSLIY